MPSQMIVTVHPGTSARTLTSRVFLATRYTLSTALSPPRGRDRTVFSAGDRACRHAGLDIRFHGVHSRPMHTFHYVGMAHCQLAWVRVLLHTVPPESNLQAAPLLEVAALVFCGVFALTGPAPLPQLAVAVCLAVSIRIVCWQFALLREILRSLRVRTARLLNGKHKQHCLGLRAGLSALRGPALVVHCFCSRGPRHEIAPLTCVITHTHIAWPAALRLARPLTRSERSLVLSVLSR